MNLKGKYTIIKKDKCGNVLSKKSQYNKITSVGKDIILNLFKNASSTDNFKEMIGYKPLDLSTYKIKPLLRNPNKNSSKKYGSKISYKTSNNNSQLYDYETSLCVLKNGNVKQFDETDNQWDVKSSLFFDNSITFGDQTYYFPNRNKTVSYPVENSTRSYFNYSQCDSHLTNNGISLKNSVDQILNYNNSVSFLWNKYSKYIGGDDNFFIKNIHNIDFFLVRCVQKVYSRTRDLQIPLWDGTHEDLLNSNVELQNPKVKFRYDFSGLDYKSIIILHKKSNGNWIALKDKNTDSTTTIDSFQINQSQMTIKFIHPNYSNSVDTGDVDQFLIFYNVYYLDDRLKNGVCGMYLNYSVTDDVQGKASHYQLQRQLFGNGVFSYDGFKTLDQFVSFPWQGKPIKIDKYSASTFRQTDRNHDYILNMGNSSISQHKIFTTSQYQDFVSQRFYSFYPYVTNHPTNFVFMLFSPNNKINIKNFVFLTPQFRTITPRVFIFGGDYENNEENSDTVLSSNQSDSSNDTIKFNSSQEIKNQLLRLDAIQCDTQTTINDQSNNEISLIIWKTYLDYNVGNDTPIKQLGLACGTDSLYETSYGWRYIKPIRKQQCNQLFSKVVLDDAIQKNQQQALEVIYELVVR